MTGKAGSVVPDLNTKRAVPAFRFNFDEAGTGAGCYSVAYCILDDGLQDKVGDFRVKRVLRHIKAGDQTVLKTNPFNFEITAKKGHLLLERNLLRTGVFQSESQKIAQARDHL